MAHPRHCVQVICPVADWLILIQRMLLWRGKSPVIMMLYCLHSQLNDGLTFVGGILLGLKSIEYIEDGDFMQSIPISH